MNRPSWSVRQAAQECGVSDATIRRRLRHGSLPNAERDTTGAWSIPVEDLLDAGLTPGKPSPPDSRPARHGVSTDHGHPDSAHDHGLINSESSQAMEVTDLRTELRIAHEQISHLTSQVHTLEGNVSDLRTAMRMLEAGSPKETTPETESQGRESGGVGPVVERPAGESSSRRGLVGWLRRRRGR